jgi:hypothetical protein
LSVLRVCSAYAASGYAQVGSSGDDHLLRTPAAEGSSHSSVRAIETLLTAATSAADAQQQAIAIDP